MCMARLPALRLGFLGLGLRQRPTLGGKDCESKCPKFIPWKLELQLLPGLVSPVAPPGRKASARAALGPDLLDPVLFRLHAPDPHAEFYKGSRRTWAPVRFAGVVTTLLQSPALPACSCLQPCCVQSKAAQLVPTTLVGFVPRSPTSGHRVCSCLQPLQACRFLDSAVVVSARISPWQPRQSFALVQGISPV